MRCGPAIAAVSTAAWRGTLVVERYKPFLGGKPLSSGCWLVGDWSVFDDLSKVVLAGDWKQICDKIMVPNVGRSANAPPNSVYLVVKALVVGSLPLLGQFCVRYLCWITVWCPFCVFAWKKTYILYIFSHWHLWEQDARDDFSGTSLWPIKHPENMSCIPKFQAFTVQKMSKTDIV